MNKIELIYNDAGDYKIEIEREGNIYDFLREVIEEAESKKIQIISIKVL